MPKAGGKLKMQQHVPNMIQQLRSSVPALGGNALTLWHLGCKALPGVATRCGIQGWWDSSTGACFELFVLFS